MSEDNLHVLLITDRHDEAERVRGLVDAADAAVKLACLSSREACAQTVPANGFDICLVGPELDGARGLDLLEQVREHGCTLPCVLLVDQVCDADYDQRARRGGAEEVLHLKDLDARLLLHCLRHAMERNALRRRLDDADRRFDMIASVSLDGIWDWDIRSDHVEFSRRWKAIIGCDPAEIGCEMSEWYERMHPSDVEKVRTEIDAHLHGRLPRLQSRHRLRHKQGHYRWVLARGQAHWDAEGNPLRFAGTLTDITSRSVTDSELQAGGAYYDALTGLPNRDVFRERLTRVIDRARRHNDYLFAVVCLDLDRFKVINDSLGHLVGDQLLVTIARRIEADLRTTDTLARIGGDVFGLLLDDIRDISDALRVADRVQEHLAQPFSLRGHEVFTTASMGIALSSHGYTEPDEVLRDADIAMHRAKSQGKARHEIFDKDMHDTAVKRLRLESGLRRAVEREEFVVHYQPIVRVADRRMAGFEALVRWNNPQEGGIVPPNDFIPIAEETGVIIAIDRWVLRESCKNLRMWLDAFPDFGPLALSFNLSRKQLVQEDLADFIQAAMDEYGLEPAQLRPEITESQIMENLEVSTSMLAKLKNLNVHLHMDDFGTGYSSLSNLVRMNIDTVKIDGSFVSNMDVRGENFEIVRMIVALAHNLGMEVIAEGVETAEQFELLKALNCECVQGFHFSRPIPPDEMTQLLTDGAQW